MINLNYKFKINIFLLFILIFGYFSGSASPTDNFSFDLDSNEYRSFPLKTNSTFYLSIISFNCQDCSISLYILNETNFELFYSGGELKSLIYEENIDEIDLVLELDLDTLYYVVIYNKDVNPAYNIILILDLEEKAINNRSNTLVAIVIVFGNLIPFFLVVYQYKAKKNVVNLSDNKKELIRQNR